MTSFHFLRPWCFLLLIPVAGLLFLFWRRRLASQSWRRVVDPQLLAHLLQGTDGRVTSWPVLWLGLWFITAVTALAGPVWQQIEQPVFRSAGALVIVLDLSRSMNAKDVAPSRLERVKLKLLDILATRQEGQTALMVYAAQPFVFSPLTEDRATIGLQVKTLETRLMPAQGSRPDRALDGALELLKQANVAQGEILLITDGLSGGDPQAIGSRVKPHRLSVLGVGTTDGAPVPADGEGFFKDSTGSIVLARLQENELDALARSGGGRYHRLSGDDRDIMYLLPSMQPAGGRSTGEEAARTEQWQEEGPWLVLLLLPFAALIFRRGMLSLVLVAILSQATPSYAFDWKDLWLRRDQQGARAMADDAPQTAADLFTDKEWQAAAHYRAGNYERALELIQAEDSETLYNRGNSLARLGRLEEALKTYEEVIEKDPDNQDAVYNHKVVKDLLDRQQQQQQDQQQQDQQQGEGDRQEGKDGQQQQVGQEGEGQRNQNQSGQQEVRQGKDQDESGNEQESGKEEQLNGSQQEGEQQGGSPEETAEKGRAMKGQEDEGQEDQQARTAASAGMDQDEQDAEQQEIEQQLRAIPDDPGKLWRRKFKYQYERQYRQQGEERQQW